MSTSWSNIRSSLASAMTSHFFPFDNYVTVHTILVILEFFWLLFFLLPRAKPEGWFRISWICSYVFFKRKVWVLHCHSLQSSHLTYPLIFLIPVFSSSSSLPWQGLKAGTKKQKYEKISEKKVSTSIEVVFYPQR